ncbi:MAG: hypothetical protein IT381_31630 [Deltaproteobacteria bacterium]|nr:hypothetical protein [Deltaproteobacteria bacterium]
MGQQKVQIELTREQALVFFEWLSRESETPGRLIFEDPAEQQALWVLEARLEKLLSEPFADNYREILAAARNKIRDNPDG